MNSRILIDTDAGVDDILALFVLSNATPKVAIDVAVTFGNVSLAQAIHNVSLYSRLSGFAPQKVLRGHAAPIRGQPHFALNVHGVDGLGGITINRHRNGVVDITTGDLSSIDAFASYDKVLAIGPLTDIAALAPHHERSPPLFVMGGAFNERGNIRPHAEFNFFSDPDAASDVFDRYGGEIFVVPLDVCRQVVLERDYFDRLCDSYRSPATIFLKDIHQHYMDFYLQLEGIDGCHPHDAMTVFAAFFRDALNWERGRVCIVTEGSERGRSVLIPDPSGRHHVALSIVPAQFFHFLEGAMRNHMRSTREI